MPNPRAPANSDTIVAIATAPGIGAVGIVRLSGPQTREIARVMLGDLPPPRRAHLARFRAADGEAIDHGLALFFPAPHSFTGEDVLELQGHGGPVVLDLVVARALALGARLARPGEFSERAFLNGKLDLVQAEAIADLIESASTAAARSAMRALEGDFSRALRAVGEALIEARLHVEAAIDFPEEEIDFLADGALRARVDALAARLTELTRLGEQGRLLREGFNVMLVGRPNVGKSSLLNRLAAYEAAIVSPMPGTTRDVLRERVLLDGVPLHVVDTAGLRDTDEPVEREGVARARAALARTDLALVLFDDPAQIPLLLAELPAQLAFVLVRNKIDLSGVPPGRSSGPYGEEIALSALSGAGLDALRARLQAVAGVQADSGAFIARRRQLDALMRAHVHVQNARAQLDARRGELMAEELRLAQRALGEITGEFTADDLLGRIFASFCIGK